MAILKIKFNVRGLVQGVGFRYFVYKNAMELDLKGYVKNYLDGSVTGIAVGSEENIDKFKAILRQGPTRSMVERVLVEDDFSQGEYLTFSIH